MNIFLVSRLEYPSCVFVLLQLIILLGQAQGYRACAKFAKWQKPVNVFIYVLPFGTRLSGDHWHHCVYTLDCLPFRHRVIIVSHSVHLMIPRRSN